MQFTTVRSKEKDYDIYLKSEKKKVQKTGSQINTVAVLEHLEKKMFPSYLEVQLKLVQLFRKNYFLAILSLTNTVAAIWREKKVDPCYLETKKCSSQLLGARKKIMTSI